MIKLYSGTPGSGKSLHVANRLYWRLRAGVPCIANFDFRVDKIKGKCKKENFKYVPNDELTPRFLKNFAMQHFKNGRIEEDSITLVIDECQLIFNARTWNDEGRKEWNDFFTVHRKFGYEIILVAQFDEMVDRQLRSLIEYEYKHRKVANFGIPGKVASIFFCGKLFVSPVMWYPLRERIGAEWFIARKKYYSLYDTFQVFEC